MRGDVARPRRPGWAAREPLRLGDGVRGAVRGAPAAAHARWRRGPGSCLLRSSFLNVRRARGSFGVHRPKGLGWLFRSLVMLFATRNGPEERASCLRQLARLTLVSWRVVSPEITVTRNLSTASRTQCACDTPGLRSCCPTSAAGRIWSCEAGLGVRPRGRGARGAGRPAPPAGRRGPCTAGLRPFSAHAAPGARRRLFHSARGRRSVWCYVS